MPMSTKRVLCLLGLVACLGPLAACDEADTPGQALDKAIENTGEAVKRAGENIKDAAR